MTGEGREGRGAQDGREPRIRLFVALELPAEVRDALISWRSPLLEAMPGLRPLAPEDLHVTLCFLGWQPSDQADRVAGACRRLAAAGPLTLSPEKTVWLPSRRPRVLAVRLRDPERRLAQLQSELSVLLEAGGWYVPEHRAFLAHVTVARVGRRLAVSPKPLPPPPEISFLAVRVTLFRSRLSPGGARYEALATVDVG